MSITPANNNAVAAKVPLQRSRDHHVNEDRSKRSPTASAVSYPSGTVKSDLTSALEELALQQRKNKISVIIGFIVVVVSIAVIIAALIARLRHSIHTLSTPLSQGQREEYGPDNFTAVPEPP